MQDHNVYKSNKVVQENILELFYPAISNNNTVVFLNSKKEVINFSDDFFGFDENEVDGSLTIKVNYDFNDFNDIDDNCNDNGITFDDFEIDGLDETDYLDNCDFEIGDDDCDDAEVDTALYGYYDTELNLDFDDLEFEEE